MPEGVNLYLRVSPKPGDEKVKELAPNVRMQETFDSIEGVVDVVLIDSKFAESLDREYLYKSIDALIKESNPVMLKGGDSPWAFTDRETPIVSTAFSLDKEDMYCLFYNSKTGASYSNSISGFDMGESVGVAYEWAKEYLDEYTSKGSTIHSNEILEL